MRSAPPAPRAALPGRFTGARLAARASVTLLAAFAIVALLPGALQRRLRPRSTPARR
ncbi:hypothetical protein [Conexibacter sp. DBS9H8]|uniref:hypothetical protein n=1 Tax=Conexibacter sp. DBS9H8 TaxID=2937801 RepID=UPI00200D15D8|nr:hypothetical protein [Conexibacter sp. DBS9H8]